MGVPEANLQRKVLCPKCKHKFVVAEQPAGVLEDVVASWLTGEGGEGGPGGLEEELGGGVGEDRAADGESTADEPLPLMKGDIRIVKVESRGAMFEFPAERLEETDFRAGFPRQCLSCDARTHLRAHVVIYASELVTDSISMEEEHSAGALVLSNEEVRGLSNEDVLQRLHHVPNVPHPGDLPMPYWVCDMCSGSGQVKGQIHVNPDTGRGWCRLVIRNLRRALQFIDNVGGRSVEGHASLRERVQQTTENPWDNLPEVVQHRIQQWFKPESGEKFVAFIPDRDHARTEDGIAGVVVSSKRLIYHTPRSHRAARKEEPIELQHASGGGRGNVSITTPEWSIKHMRVDRDGLSRMRRGLTLGKFRAMWH